MASCAFGGLAAPFTSVQGGCSRTAEANKCEEKRHVQPCWLE